VTAAAPAILGRILSFLDEPDEPARPRRPAGAVRPGVDRQTLMARRTVAGGAAVLVLILLVLGVRGCLDARKERALKDYVRDADALAQESDQQGAALFELLSGPGGQDQAVDVENSLNGFRVQSAQLVDRARSLDHPGEVDQAHDYLIETLEFRRDGLAKVANALPTALGDQDRREGTDEVTAQMQALLASDVIYFQRFVPLLGTALRDEDLATEVRTPSNPDLRFVPDIEWLDPAFVADRVSGVRTGDGDAAPGLHGNALGTVTLGGETLTPDGSTTVTLSDELTFEVQVANQGDNTETDVAVRVTVGEGDDAIELEEPLDTIAAGETKTVTLALEEQPPTGQNVPIEVEVEPVPGEEMTDNNIGTFSAIFTR
jgi:CARDB protein